jgi:hypothetical protein
MRYRFQVQNALFAGICVVALCIGIVESSNIASAQFRNLPQKHKFVTPDPGKSLYDNVKGEDKGSRIAMPFKSDRSVTMADITELTRRSSDIIIGRPLRSRSFLSEQGKDVYSMNLIQVQTVIKGSIKNGSVVDLKTPGGAWMYSDGTRISRFPSDARLLRENASYFLFIKKENKDKKHWVPAVGIQSQFEVDSDTNSITPCDLVETDPVVKKYKNAPMGEFVSEIIAAVAAETPGNHARENPVK